MLWVESEWMESTEGKFSAKVKRPAEEFRDLTD